MNQIHDHTGSRLGKWYYQGLGFSTFGKLQSYRNFEPHLVNMHKSAYNALTSISNKGVSEKLGYLEKMEESSNDLITILSVLNDDLHTMAQTAMESDTDDDVLF
jgi:hypothetical protein